jgi:hypothetical protein
MVKPLVQNLHNRRTPTLMLKFDTVKAFDTQRFWSQMVSMCGVNAF